MKKHLLISEDAIREQVFKAAHWIDEEYRDSDLIIVFILKGSICLVADLIRELTIPFQIQPISASSYGMRGKTPGKVEVSVPSPLDLEGKEVLLVDDILDTGNTLAKVALHLESLGANRVKSLVLLRKVGKAPDHLAADYVCFDIEDHFVVGYGLDYKEYDRGLKAIYTIE